MARSETEFELPLLSLEIFDELLELSEVLDVEELEFEERLLRDSDDDEELLREELELDEELLELEEEDTLLIPLSCQAELSAPLIFGRPNVAKL